MYVLVSSIDRWRRYVLAYLKFVMKRLFGCTDALYTDRQVSGAFYFTNCYGWGVTSEY